MEALRGSRALGMGTEDLSGEGSEALSEMGGAEAPSGKGAEALSGDGAKASGRARASTSMKVLTCWGHGEVPKSVKSHCMHAWLLSAEQPS